MANSSFPNQSKSIHELNINGLFSFTFRQLSRSHLKLQFASLFNNQNLTSNNPRKTPRGCTKDSKILNAIKKFVMFFNVPFLYEASLIFILHQFCGASLNFIARVDRSCLSMFHECRSRHNYMVLEGFDTGYAVMI